MQTKKLFVIAALLTALGLILMSCGPAALPTGQGPTPRAASSDAKTGTVTDTPKPSGDSPRPGGILTAYLTADPPSLDAQQESTTNTSTIVAPFYTNLVQADPLTADKWVPGLAEKWEMSPDGLTWTLDIRQGVKFHDGSDFTTDDAIFNLKRLIDPPKGFVSNLSFLLKPVVKSVQKEGNKVKISLTHPFAIMLDTLGLNYSVMYSQKYVESQGDMKRTAMGTGPFKFKSYTPGVGLEGVRNADFWIKGRPYLEGYRFLILKDAATRVSAFRTGKVNMTGRMLASLTPVEVEGLSKENAELKFYPGPTQIGVGFFMNIRKPPFQDPRVRKAVSLALDRQAALKVLAQGQGIVGKPFPKEQWGGVPVNDLLKMPGLRQPKEADIAEAKKLMETAGYPSGFEVTILARQMAQSREPAVFMTDQLSPLGIKAKVNLQEDAVFWDAGRKAAHEAMVYNPSTMIADPHWLGRFWTPGGTLNFSGNEADKQLIQMWDEQIKTVDPEKRKAMLRKVEEYLLETVPGVHIVWYTQIIGARPEVRNFFPGTIVDTVGNTLEEIWLAK
ncbi:MAG: hypothetical protein HYX92_14255 [Chloroflexi bacterium]|nr:hypothetical protein [Chloroflexota bacterium]